MKASASTRFLEEQCIEVLYSSPYRRALDTVEPFPDAAGLQNCVEADLRERKLTYGFRNDRSELIHQAWIDLRLALPGCESGLECQARNCAYLDDHALCNRGRTIAVTSHGSAIALYLNSLDKTFGFQEWVSMKAPDVFVVDYPPVGMPVSDANITVYLLSQ